MGNWVVRGGELIKAEDVMLEDGEVLEPLSAYDLLRHILMAAKGEKVTLSEDDTTHDEWRGLEVTRN